MVKSKILTILLTLFILWLVSYSFSNIIDKDIKGINKIAIIPIKGAITIEGLQGFSLEQSATSSTKVVEFIKQAEKDSSIKGIIFEINSPGGTVVATREITNEIKKTTKPTVAWIRETGASGAYWIASATDTIVADPLSITGSVGVISSYLAFEDLFNKYGITYERLVAGEYKDAGSPYKKLKEKEKEFLQGKLDIIHQAFIEEIIKNRNLNQKAIQELKKASFYLGIEALELGLVDKLGGKDLAINITKEKANIKQAKLVRYKETKTIFDMFTKVSTTTAYTMGKGIGSELFKLQEPIEITL